MTTQLTGERHWVQQPGRVASRIYRPTTVIDALRLLRDRDGSRPLAGGTDLLVELDRGGPGADIELVDLTAIAALRCIDTEVAPSNVYVDERQPKNFVVGSGATHNQIIAHSGLCDGALPLVQACLEIGSPQLRNRATVGGNLSTASPANDTISALVAMEAQLELVSCDENDSDTSPRIVSRTVRIGEFFAGLRKTVLRPGELIATVTVPSLGSDRRGVWAKLGLRKAQAISVVHAGLVVDFDHELVVTKARLALGSVSPIVGLCPEAEAQLVGCRLDPPTITAAAQAAADSVNPIDDGRATAAYRRQGVHVIVKRMLGALAQRDERRLWPAWTPGLDIARELPAAEEHQSSRDEPLPRAPGDREPANGANRSSIDDIKMTSMEVNGASVRARRAASSTLLDWIRNNVATGTKEGCAEGECGACTVLVDGKAVMSCLVLAGQVADCSVRTVEGLADQSDQPGRALLNEVQSSFVERFAVQCGFCIPGFVVAATALIAEANESGHRLDRADVERGLAGNLCRCTGYYSIIEAVLAAQGSKS